jgi:peptide/nickel transport system substrate-binding protein
MTVSNFGRAAILALVLGLSGCGQNGGSHRDAGHPLPSSHLVAQCEPGLRGGRFVIAAPASPRTFNPLFAFDSASDAITRLLFGSLVSMNLVTHEAGPGLAESWSVTPDGKTWTFKLRPGLLWSDGQPLTADDVVFTWNSVMYNPDFNKITYDLFRIGGKNFEVTRVDDVTVRVVTPEVFAPFVEFFGCVQILPKHALEWSVTNGKFPAAYAVNTPPERIVGCGPYRVKEFRANQSTLLERNPEYWVADRQGQRLPYFDEVTFNVSGGPGTEPLVFLAGKSDVCESIKNDAYDQFKQAAAARGFQLLELGAGTERDFLWFNQNTGVNSAGQPIVNPVKLKWFREKKFRQAVACAIDRERLAREVYGGRAKAITSFISSENPKWNNTNIPRFEFDPARSRALLTELGFQDRSTNGVLSDAEGHSLEINFLSNAGNPTREKSCRLIQEDLKKVGIQLDYLPIDFRLLVEKINSTFDYECALMGLGGGGVDPASQLNVLRSSEELHQWFPLQKTPATEWEARIDTLMEHQMRTLDFAQRKKDFDEVQAILAEEQPMIYTVSPFSYAALRANIANVRPSVLTAYRVTWNLEELYFKKK